MNSIPPTSDDAVVTPLCVLVVDDEAAITEEIVDWLTMRGITCYSASNAAKAMEILAAFPAITVMLTDIHMPDTNGITLAMNALASRLDEHALEVVMLTAHATRNYAIDALRARAMDFLPKPATFAVLQAALDRAHASAVIRRRHHCEAAALVARLRSSIHILEKTASVAPGEGVRRNVLSSIGHEILTALHQIMGFAELIGQNPATPQPDDLREYAQILLTAGTNLSEHTRMLLQFLEVEAVPRAAHSVSQALPELLDFLAKSYRARAAQRRQSIRVDCPRDISLHTDGDLLEQILRYLLSAALRFGAEKGSIVLGARPDQEGVRIFVIESPADDDIGPLLEKHDDTHGSLSTLTLSRAGEGVAVGISTFQAARLGGHLEVETQSNGISVATLTLPATLCLEALP